MTAEIVRLPRRNWTEKRVIHLEETEAWKRVHGLVQRTHLSLVAGREDWASDHLTEIAAVTDRRLRQLRGDSNDAA